eukprot:scaffold36016_cov129-Isochrysis_galbana.AAC.3
MCACRCAASSEVAALPPALQRTMPGPGICGAPNAGSLRGDPSPSMRSPPESASPLQTWRAGPGRASTLLAAARSAPRQHGLPGGRRTTCPTKRTGPPRWNRPAEAGDVFPAGRPR